MRLRHPPQKAGVRLSNHGDRRFYRLWIVVCVLTSVWFKKDPSLNGHSRAHTIRFNPFGKKDA
eukprot:1604402-Amphidinium_carterae.1